MKIIVIGAGVAGLTTAVHLSEVLMAVKPEIEVWASQVSPNTTSDLAGAVWYPSKLEPREAVQNWSTRTLWSLINLSDDLSSGVRTEMAKKFFHRPMGNPWWAEHTPNFRRLNAQELREGAICGYRFTAPVVEMSVYLAYLHRWFERNGGSVIVRTVSSLEEACGLADTVIICAGLGARKLAADSTVYPIRGQLLQVSGGGLPPEVILDSDHPDGLVYIVPRNTDFILGGTSEPNKFSLDSDPKVTDQILARCRRFLPALHDCEVLSARVGLRPARPAVRLEKVGNVIYNYGHGGAGLTLSWGCAESVAALLRRNG